MASANSAKPKAKAKTPPKARAGAKRKRYAFKLDDYVVYPAHGVGRVAEIRSEKIAGSVLELFVVDFSEDRMRLSVPVEKVASVGLRGIADARGVKRAFQVLRGPVKVRRTMWSRRAQEYESKINSGELHVVAEVVRDLYRSCYQPERSYSERQLFERALERMAREVAAVRQVSIAEASEKIEEILARAADRKQAAEERAAEAAGSESAPASAIGS